MHMLMSQEQMLVRRLTSDTEFATAVKLQQLHDAATAAVKFLKVMIDISAAYQGLDVAPLHASIVLELLQAMSTSSHHPSFREGGFLTLL